MSDRTIRAQVTVKVFSDGALSIEGPVDDTVWMLALLDHMRDAIKHRAQARRKPATIELPAHDVTLIKP